MALNRDTSATEIQKHLILVKTEIPALTWSWAHQEYLCPPPSHLSIISLEHHHGPEGPLPVVGGGAFSGCLLPSIWISGGSDHVTILGTLQWSRCSCHLCSVSLIMLNTCRQDQLWDQAASATTQGHVLEGLHTWFNSLLSPSWNS